MSGSGMSLAVLVVSALSGVSLTYGLLFGTALLGYTPIAAVVSLALFALAWVLDRRLNWAWSLRALWLGLHIGGIIAMWRFMMAFSEGSQ